MEGCSTAFDLSISDYLVHNATQDLFASEKTPNQVSLAQAKASLQLVYAFQALFKIKHQHAQIPTIVRLRLQLLQQTLYWSSYSEDLLQFDSDYLQLQRAAHRSRASKYIRTKYVSNKSGCRPIQYDPLPNPPHRTLLDAVPDLMSVSARYFHMSDKTIGPKWIQLAIDIMSSAVVDQHVNHGAKGRAAVSLAFAYGFSLGFMENGRKEEELAMASLFWDPITEKENENWTIARASALDQVRLLGD